jgi:hypothetical protein
VGSKQTLAKLKGEKSMSCTTPFGPFNFEVTSKAAKPKIGQLSLSYTLSYINESNQITCATITYSPPNNGTSQSFDVTFTGTAPPYSGGSPTVAMTSNWNVPGEGVSKYATFSFTPPAGGSLGTLTGTASKDPIAGEDNTITFEADPSVGEPAPHPKQYGAGT